MFVDALGEICSSQAFSTDAVSENTIDLANVTPNRQIGTGEPMAVVINVESAGTGAGAYRFNLLDDSDEALGSPRIIASIFPTEAELALGAILVLPVPVGFPTQRYLGIGFDNVSGSTAVTVSAYLMPLSMVQAYKSYADGFNIS